MMCSGSAGLEENVTYPMPMPKTAPTTSISREVIFIASNPEVLVIGLMSGKQAEVVFARYAFTVISNLRLTTVG